MLRARLLKIILFLSLPWALFWTLGLILDDKDYLPSLTFLSVNSTYIVSLIVLYTFTLLVMAVLSKLSPSFLLIQPSVRTSMVVKEFLLSAIITYIGVALITFIIANAFITVDPSVPNERALLVTLISMWLPIWWILPISTLVTGMLLSRRRE